MVFVVDVEGFLFTLLSLHRTCRRTIQLYRNKVQILIYMATFPRDYRITVFATCHSIRRVQTGLSSSASLSYSSDSDRSYLCRSWQRLVTHRLMCFRQEAANNTSDEAGSSIQQRIQQVFRIHCISSFSSSGSKPYKTNSFYVTDAGVEFTSV